MPNLQPALAGALSGAAGTSALNAATYLDMAARGRPSSSTPEQTVDTLSRMAHVPLGGEKRKNRLAGLGPLMGLGVGVGIGAAAGSVAAAVPPVRSLPLGAKAALVGLGAMALTDVPMAALGISDPRTWPASSWLSDLLPHLAYGAVTAVALQRLTRGEPLR